MAGSSYVVEVRDFLFAPTTRKWIYGVSIAVIALLQGYGILIDTQAELWTGIASAVVGMANLGVLSIPNVPTVNPYTVFGQTTGGQG